MIKIGDRVTVIFTTYANQLDGIRTGDSGVVVGMDDYDYTVLFDDGVEREMDMLHVIRGQIVPPKQVREKQTMKDYLMDKYYFWKAYFLGDSKIEQNPDVERFLETVKEFELFYHQTGLVDYALVDKMSSTLWALTMDHEMAMESGE